MVPTVHLVLVLHDEEGVVVQITEELDVGPVIKFSELTVTHGIVAMLTRLSSSIGNP